MKKQISHNSLRAAVGMTCLFFIVGTVSYLLRPPEEKRAFRHIFQPGDVYEYNYSYTSGLNIDPNQPGAEIDAPERVKLDSQYSSTWKVRVYKGEMDAQEQTVLVGWQFVNPRIQQTSNHQDRVDYSERMKELLAKEIFIKMTPRGEILEVLHPTYPADMRLQMEQLWHSWVDILNLEFPVEESTEWTQTGQDALGEYHATYRAEPQGESVWTITRAKLEYPALGLSRASMLRNMLVRGPNIEDYDHYEFNREQGRLISGTGETSNFFYMPIQTPQGSLQIPVYARRSSHYHLHQYMQEPADQLLRALYQRQQVSSWEELKSQLVRLSPRKERNQDSFPPQQSGSGSVAWAAPGQSNKPRETPIKDRQAVLDQFYTALEEDLHSPQKSQMILRAGKKITQLIRQDASTIQTLKEEILDRPEVPIFDKKIVLDVIANSARPEGQDLLTLLITGSDRELARMAMQSSLLFANPKPELVEAVRKVLAPEPVGTDEYEVAIRVAGDMVARVGGASEQGQQLIALIREKGKQSKTEADQMAYVNALGNTLAAEVAPDLEAILRTTTAESVKAGALSQLARTKTTQATQLLLEAARTSDQFMPRQIAVQALAEQYVSGELGPHQAEVETYLRTLASDPAQPFIYRTTALGAMTDIAMKGDPQAAALLEQTAATDPDKNIRQYAEEALGKVAMMRGNSR